MIDPRSEALYQETILDHYRRPRNKGELPGANARATVTNPTCGDEIGVEAIVEGGMIRDVRFTGQGCSIAQASASMMTDVVRGATVGAARRTGEALRRLLAGEPVTRDALGELLAFEAVARYPARVGCALMPWRALDRALQTSGNPAP
ncbi:MAG: SUF system NifU family Fe-S cluster assembly protein [Gemmatimonadaceae bacterium]|nr:SUF system NifU family Fe-S cluster assembly protein [Gemmatimonadaceae bacterium]NUQ91589.1 SUF system NifU family Fe-S cluster assembly protein [Gemmatimonadaceae bacterium]NUR20812.1 SUF system NifU family Fe-S cluster assembly protein [Gemmatimonadaceae bacterium]NUS96671.1 SUF system NifU family Fe-S cluster assembly protein [Gemmatimonadaceae bacterium]